MGRLPRFFQQITRQVERLYFAGNPAAAGRRETPRFAHLVLKSTKTDKSRQRRAQRWTDSVYHIEKHHHFIKKRYVVR
jgi:hypothetical protein